MKPDRYVLLGSMIARFVFGFLCIGGILFVSAGSLRYMNGWLFIIALSIPMVVFGAVLLIKEPSTLARRLQSNESDKTQRAVVGLSAFIFVAAFVLSGLNYRFAWPGVPFFVTVAAIVILLAGYALSSAVILQNAYAARVVAIYEDQKLITTGVYAVVRHPMYTGSILMFMSMPFILGSWIAALPMLCYPLMIARRIKNEETLLLRELDGYSDYMGKVKYRLLPFVW